MNCSIYSVCIVCLYLVNRCIDQHQSVQADLSLAPGTLQGILQICLCPEYCRLLEQKNTVHMAYLEFQMKITFFFSMLLTLFTNAVTSLSGVLTLLALLMGTARASAIVTWPCVYYVYRGGSRKNKGGGLD